MLVPTWSFKKFNLPCPLVGEIRALTGFYESSRRGRRCVLNGRCRSQWTLLGISLLRTIWSDFAVLALLSLKSLVVFEKRPVGVFGYLSLLSHNRQNHQTRFFRGTGFAEGALLGHGRSQEGSSCRQAPPRAPRPLRHTCPLARPAAGRQALCAGFEQGLWNHFATATPALVRRVIWRHAINRFHVNLQTHRISWPGRRPKV